MSTHGFMLALAISILVAMLVCQELGRWIGQRELRRDPEATRFGTGVIDAGVFGLLGLLLAFAFSGAASRFEDRRQIIVQEANAIGTAWLRLDLLPPAQQPELREMFRQYTDARIATYEKIPDLDAVAVELNRASKLQGDIWNAARSAVQNAADPQMKILVLPPINDMFDMSTSRSSMMLTHTPWIIIALLICSALLGSMLAAYAGADKPRHKMHILIFNVIIAITIYVIMDLDYPRVGLIRESSVDRVMWDVRTSMK